jgi:UDP-2,3-diacylglucosamine pyrophosphatase LpxH
MEEEETRAFIVISDTHLGLRAGKRLHFFPSTVSHRPTHVDQFVKWLEELQNKGEIEVPIVIEELHDKGEYEIKEIGSKKISFPDKLVLNGDIFELWDASDQSIQFASHSILSSISRLSCEKLYLIGNHDFANAELAEKEVQGKVDAFSNLYPWGLSDLKIIRDSYPIPRDGKILTLRTGQDHYLLLHGHQFDMSFGIDSWKILPALRDGAEAFRLYSWFLVLLWIVWIGSLPIIAHLNPSIFPLIQYAIGIPLTVLAIPRIFVSIARPIWDRFFGSRYKGNKAQTGFIAWWDKFTKKNELQTNRIHIIYGHTHRIQLGKKEFVKIINKKFEKVGVTLINHPAWVKDTKNEYKYELREVFVYADKYGFEFFGWRWDDSSPFQIPKSVLLTYASGRQIDNDTAKILSSLNWPEKLIQELKESGSTNPSQ